MQRNSVSLISALSVALLLPALTHGATLVIKGSDTLGGKLVPQIAEGFKAATQPKEEALAIEIAAEGSATGIASVIDGAADIGMLSRPLGPAEIAEAEARGMELTSIPIARDALVVIVNDHNTLTSISIDDLSAIFSGDIKNWASLSNETGDISVYTRNTSSGTYVSFRSLALGHRDYSKDIQKMAGNEQIALEVASNPNAIGYVGLAYAKKPGIRPLAIEGHMPDDRAYPLARPLFFLVDDKEDRSRLRNEFIDFTLSPEGQLLIERAQFLPITPTQ